MLVWRGRTLPLERYTEEPTVAGCDAPVLAAEQRRYLVAFGSNASPDRLVDKRLDVRGVLLLPGDLEGWRPAWEARRSTSTGAVPLTLVPAPGRRVPVHVLGVHPEDLERLDASEFRGRNYELGEVGDVAVAARWHLRRALAYGPGRMTEVLVDADGGPLAHPTYGQAEAASRLEAGGPTAAVPALGRPVPEGWPATPLAPLDLFVYGTLQPGEGRWSAIAHLVDVLGPAVTTGRLHDTGRGWPAAVPAPDGEEIHGTLLRPRGAAAAAELYRTADRVEAEGELFVRVAVRVRGPDGEGWAATYAWGAGARPGPVIVDGRWGGGPGRPSR